jgi:hypothetical protein
MVVGIERGAVNMTMPHLTGAVGLVVIIFGIWQLVQRVGFLRRSVKTDGRLVAWERPGLGDLGTAKGPGGSWRAVVSYSAGDGSRHRIRGSTPFRSWNRTDVRKKEVVPVRYDPSNPKDARIATVQECWLAPVLSVVAGVFLLLLALRA